MEVHYEIIHILFAHAKYFRVVLIAYGYFRHRGQSALLPRQKAAILYARNLNNILLLLLSFISLPLCGPFVLKL